MTGPFLEFFFGCGHHNQTRPFTLNRTCYKVCLDCGRELPYSWAEMRLLKPSECTHARPSTCEEVRATA